LVDVPQEVIMQTYELLRPGRAQSKAELLDRAEMLRKTYGAEQIADFVARAAEIYHLRGLFGKRSAGT
jgi:propanediol dehydratase small subunit